MPIRIQRKTRLKESKNKSRRTSEGPPKIEMQDIDKAKDNFKICK